VDGAEDVVESELAAFGLLDRADALPRNLSSGQRRRLALAAAFVRPARLLVLDEPERRLDTAMRDTLAGRLTAARDGGQAVLFASHDAAVVRTVAQSAVLLDDVTSAVLAPERAAAAMTQGDG